MTHPRKLDQIGITLVDATISAVHIRKGDQKPAEHSVTEIIGYPGTYRLGKTYFDDQGRRCVKVTRLH
ncbi:hypothetical protein HNQ07_003593 [Deinococcus metalli]|uniref:Uncharacterized protein n=1 Tax=Deinococcus metalli TaxID=1141878 RepID=A0A7W8KHA0_9DEIO|nr:hypothetical protein [Deinococcus metalli]MBB5378092.1 hypothetical protein [Deinococcus metalli]GHF54361.1 hypothetical protein GCM10017781_33340 [Deinococcus metalli]